jgi:ribosomal protein S18 acetylase RimI-like enzyme
MLRMIDLVGAARRSRPGCGYLHAGDLQWMLRAQGLSGIQVHLWEDGSELAAFVVLEPPGYMVLELAPVYNELRLSLLEWAETRIRTAGSTSTEVSAYDDDLFVATLRGRGYEAAAGYSHELILELEHSPALVAAPDGFALRSLRPDEDSAYVALHRDAWSTWGPSNYSQVVHTAVTSMPGFERDLVPLAVASNGVLAAYGIGWFDAITNTVEIEPLGTRPQFRRLGLARTVVAELIRRSWERGARSVMVRAVSFNHAAVDLYASLGFRSIRLLRDYSRSAGGPA